jgi:hypothetical protein
VIDGDYLLVEFIIELLRLPKRTIHERTTPVRCRRSSL